MPLFHGSYQIETLCTYQLAALYSSNSRSFSAPSPLIHNSFHKASNFQLKKWSILPIDERRRCTLVATESRFDRALLLGWRKVKSTISTVTTIQRYDLHSWRNQFQFRNRRRWPECVWPLDFSLRQLRKTLRIHLLCNSKNFVKKEKNLTLKLKAKVEHARYYLEGY